MQRHLGQETEYAIRWTSTAGSDRPTNETIYLAMRDAIGRLTQTLPGPNKGLHPAVFVANGGSFYYEAPYQAMEMGLIEGQTPECASPAELVLYQRAQERMLGDAIPLAMIILRKQGFTGDLGLLKNSRDAFGNIYGSQENYDARVGHGFSLLLWRLAVVLSIAWVALTFLFPLVVGFFCLMFSSWREIRTHALIEDSQAAEAYWQKLEHELTANLMQRYGKPFLWALMMTLWPVVLTTRLFAFSRVKRGLEGFLMSRVIFTGAGSLGDDGQFYFSEKATAVQRLTHLLVSDKEKVVFESFHIWKSFFASGERLGWRSRVRGIFSGPQRLQIGMSDSNRAQFAEYLKVGATALVVEMADKGLLRDAPRFVDPIGTLRAINADGTLAKRYPCRDGKERSAIDMQRWYLGRVKQHLQDEIMVSVDSGELIQLWQEVLTALQDDPSSLIGRLDWVGKKYLMETSGRDLSPEALKKIDLKYHELGSGYFNLLEERGLAPSMFRAAQIDDAIANPPATMPAKIRSRFIKSVAYHGKPASISWREFRIERDSGKAEIIPFDRFFRKSI